MSNISELANASEASETIRLNMRTLYSPLLSALRFFLFPPPCSFNDHLPLLVKGFSLLGTHPGNELSLYDVIGGDLL